MTGKHANRWDGELVDLDRKWSHSVLKTNG